MQGESGARRAFAAPEFALELQAWRRMDFQE
jgi:hypothetical protein